MYVLGKANHYGESQNMAGVPQITGFYLITINLLFQKCLP